MASNRVKSIAAEILGKHWEIVWLRRLRRLPDGKTAAGWCDPPDSAGKQIRIRDGMDEETELDTLIHEMLHAAAWHVREDLVDQFASDAARVLTKLGWRKNGCEDS